LAAQRTGSLSNETINFAGSAWMRAEGRVNAVLVTEAIAHDAGVSGCAAAIAGS
jgi:hypothetical protein